MGLIILDDDDEDSPTVEGSCVTLGPNTLVNEFPRTIAGYTSAITLLEGRRAKLGPDVDEE